MSESWTDERLDDRFDRVDADLRAVRTELGTFGVETNERFDKLEARLEKRFDRWEERFDRWQRLMFSIMATLAIGLLTIALSHL